MSRDTVKMWFGLAYIALISTCIWLTLLVWHSVHQPPTTTKEKARQDFVSGCDNSRYGNRYGVPDTHTDKWTCTITNGTAP